MIYERLKLFLKFQYHKCLHNHSPLVALLHLTSRCNLNCSYCYTEHSGEFPDLPIENWKQIVDTLKSKGCELIFIMGGEPLLYKDFLELIYYVQSKGLQCHLTTNGTLLPQYVATLKSLDLLMVSLDGNKISNDLNRGHGTWKLTTDGIKIAKENKIPLRINCVLTRNNVTDIEWLLNFGKENSSFVGFTIPVEPKNPNPNIFLSDKEILEAHLKLLKLSEEGKQITLSQKSLEHVVNYPKAYTELILKGESLSKYYPECCYGRYIIFIDAEGSIYPCTTLWEQRSLFQPKNIFRDGFDSALKNAQTLPCHICSCAGGIEWNEMTSFHGLIHAVKFTLSQWRLQHARNN